MITVLLIALVVLAGVNVLVSYATLGVAREAAEASEPLTIVDEELHEKIDDLGQQLAVAIDRLPKTRSKRSADEPIPMTIVQIDPPVGDQGSNDQ